MKKTLIIFLMLTGLFCSQNSAFSTDDSSYMSIDEYSQFFELGFFDEAPQTNEAFEEQEEIFTPKLKEKVDLTGDVITPDKEPIKLQVGKTEFLESYKEAFKEEESKNELLKAGKLSIFSDTTEEQSSYMTNNYKSSMNMKLDLNKNMTVQAGQEIWYVNPDASLGSKKFYINPSFYLGKGVSLNYTGRYNQTSRNIEQELGLNYKPSIFKDAASFGVSASTIMNTDKEVQSGRLKFSTDLYIY